MTFSCFMKNWRVPNNWNNSKLNWPTRKVGKKKHELKKNACPIKDPNIVEWMIEFVWEQENSSIKLNATFTCK